MTHSNTSAHPHFRPPFCPNPRCVHHRRAGGLWRWKRAGFHFRKAAPHAVQRFRCLTCGRSFSEQTFRTTYWLKRPELLPQIYRQLRACSGYRQTARILDCAHATVLNQARRLGRHCLLFQHRHAPPAAPSEPWVLDGLQSFELSQYWPFDLNCVVGAKSHFLHGFNIAELRRSGSMTARQKIRRAELERLHGKPRPRATEETVETLLRRVTGGPCRFALLTDQHRSYPRALGRMKDWTVQHERSSSKASRTPRNPLWPANLLDEIVRHDSANHKRETIAFSKRRQSVLLRAAVFQVDRNFVRGVRVRDGARSPSPAMLLSLKDRRLSAEEVLGERLFPSRVEPPDDVAEMYWERIETRQWVGRQRRHELKYAA